MRIEERQLRFELFAEWMPSDEGELLTSDDEYTPPELVDEIRDFFGGVIELDPCAAPRAFVRAEVQYTQAQNGLDHSWVTHEGRKIRSRFLNPPYSCAAPWVYRIAEIYNGSIIDPGSTIALLKCDPSTRWWQPCWLSNGIVFLDRRVPFVKPGRLKRDVAKFPSALVYWGPHGDGFCDWFGFLGYAFQPRGEEEMLALASTEIAALVGDAFAGKAGR